MIDYTPEYKISRSGKYLVKTVSQSILKTTQYLEANCILTDKGTSIDVSNQTVIAISTLPLDN